MNIGPVQIRMRPIPEACDDCECRPWAAWLKPSFTTFRKSPIQIVWAWSFWFGPIHVFRPHPEEGLPMLTAATRSESFALRKSDPANHTFMPCANADGRKGHNFSCAFLCIHCGKNRKAHE